MVEIPQVQIPDINYSNFTSNIINYGMGGYMSVMGIFLYPFIFSIIIISTFLYFRSAVLSVSIALILFVLIGNGLLGVELWTTFIHITLALTFTMLLLLFIIRRREK